MQKCLIDCCVLESQSITQIQTINVEKVCIKFSVYSGIRYLTLVTSLRGPFLNVECVTFVACGRGI